MSYELTTRLQNDVLIARVTGSRSSKTVIATAEALISLCNKHQVNKVLVDVRGLEGRLSTADIFFLVTKHFKTLKDLHLRRQAAIVDRNLSEDRHRFLENVALNRDFNFRIFGDFDEAMEWLRKPTTGEPSPRVDG